MEETEKVKRYSEIEFKFRQPLTPEQEDIFIGYFKTMKHSVMDRLQSSINGTDRNPIKAFIKKNASQHAPHIMLRYQQLYTNLQLQTMNPGPEDIFIVEDEKKSEGIWTFKMDMEAFDVSPFGEIKIPILQRQALNLMNSKDKRIKSDFMRSVLPMMKLSNGDCWITTKFYDEQVKQ